MICMLFNDVHKVSLAQATGSLACPSSWSLKKYWISTNVSFGVTQSVEKLLFRCRLCHWFPDSWLDILGPDLFWNKNGEQNPIPRIVMNSISLLSPGLAVHLNSELRLRCLVPARQQSCPGIVAIPHQGYACVPTSTWTPSIACPPKIHMLTS